MSRFLDRNLACARPKPLIAVFRYDAIPIFGKTASELVVSKAVDPAEVPRGDLHGFEPAVVADVGFAVDLEDEAVQCVAFL